MERVRARDQSFERRDRLALAECGFSVFFAEDFTAVEKRRTEFGIVLKDGHRSEGIERAVVSLKALILAETIPQGFRKIDRRGSRGFAGRVADALRQCGNQRTGSGGGETELGQVRKNWSNVLNQRRQFADV
uniref:Uncharacterized protein n=1 Tax=uncultured marine virus TaxID=186617 RepID=A0A0F7L8T6_9VIRU|nr:hypothetical protein [uncultured marine virus]